MVLARRARDSGKRGAAALAVAKHLMASALEPEPGGDITKLSAATMAELVRRHALSPVEIVDACLARIEAANPQLNAMVTLVAQQARATATVAEYRVMRGDTLGPLHGVPVGVCDMTDTAGIRTTYGSPRFKHHVPEADALLVARPKRAGAIVLGKTNVAEFGIGGGTDNRVFGVTRNPWNPALAVGGSIGGGAVALASGMVALADGTDLGGCMRAPAGYCGVVAMRPSLGLVPLYPSAQPWDTLQVAGLMARTATDAALMLGAMAGPTRMSPLAAGRPGEDFAAGIAGFRADGLRVAYIADIAGVGTDPAVARVCRAAADALVAAGAELSEVELDLAAGRTAYLTLRAEWAANRFVDRLDRLDEMGAEVAAGVRRGLNQSTRDVARANALRADVWRRVNALWTRFDVVLTPAAAVPAFPADGNGPDTIGGRPMASPIDWAAQLFVLSLTGLPVASVPAGFDPDGLPIGLQIAGPRFAEAAILGAAEVIQGAGRTGWAGSDAVVA